MLVADIDPPLARWIAAALARQYRWGCDQGLNPPRAMLELAEHLQFRASSGQAGTEVGGRVDLVDDARVAPLLMTRTETARRLGVSERQITRLVAVGQLRKVKVGGSTRYRRDEVDDLVRRESA